MLNINLTELPTCQCGKSKLLPVEDVTQGGAVYFKGWFCPVCNKSWLFNAGVILIKDVNPSLS